LSCAVACAVCCAPCCVRWVRCLCAGCAAGSTPDAPGGLMGPSSFERHAGAGAQKKWKASCRWVFEGGSREEGEAVVVDVCDVCAATTARKRWNLTCKNICMCSTLHSCPTNTLSLPPLWVLPGCVALSLLLMVVQCSCGCSSRDTNQHQGANTHQQQQQHWAGFPLVGPASSSSSSSSSSSRCQCSGI
jgi:hypothetical protein